jgi:hypothetical protein
MKSPFSYKVAEIEEDETEATAYLISLAFSEYCYHIDDDPRDIAELSSTDSAFLCIATAAACRRLERGTPIQNDGAWAVYYAALLACEKLPLKPT